MDVIDEEKAEEAQNIPSDAHRGIKDQPQKEKEQSPLFAGQFPDDLNTAPYEVEKADEYVDVQKNQGRKRQLEAGRQMHHADDHGRKTQRGGGHADPGYPGIAFEFGFHVVLPLLFLSGR